MKEEMSKFARLSIGFFTTFIGTILGGYIALSGVTYIDHGDMMGLLVLLPCVGVGIPVWSFAGGVISSQVGEKIASRLAPSKYDVVFTIAAVALTLSIPVSLLFISFLLD